MKDLKELAAQMSRMLGMEVAPRPPRDDEEFLQLEVDFAGEALEQLKRAGIRPRKQIVQLALPGVKR